MIKTSTLIIILLSVIYFIPSSLASHNTSDANSSISFINNVNINGTLISDDQILIETLGPRRRSLNFIVFMCTIYILIFLCGLIGNLCACCVIVCNNCMHTTTNYYLFSLAVSDVFSLSIGLPPELYTIAVTAYPWPFGNAFCVVRTFIFETTTIASGLTILAFTFERWLHICKPIYAQRFSNSFGRALKVIIIIWLLSASLAVPYTIGTGSELFIKDISDSKLCKPLDKYKDLMSTIILLSSILLFIVPMVLISIMYVCIGVTLWRSHAKKKSSRSAGLIKSRCFNLFRNTKRIKTNNTINSSIISSSTSVPQINPTEQKTLLDSNINEVSNNNNNNNKIDSCNNDNNNLESKNALSLAYSEFSIYEKAGNNLNINSTRKLKELEYVNTHTKQSRRDVIKMLFVVVICFFLCWAPHHLQRLVTYAYAQDLSNSNTPVPDIIRDILELLFYISGILVYVSSTVNPIVYNVMSKRYRTAFKNTLRMICTCSCKSSDKRSNFYKNNYNSSYLSNHRSNISHTSNNNNIHRIQSNFKASNLSVYRT